MQAMGVRHGREVPDWNTRFKLNQFRAASASVSKDLAFGPQVALT